MSLYEATAKREVRYWSERMQKHPSITNKITENVQKTINQMIPEKIHNVITAGIREMIKAVQTGSKYIAPKPQQCESLQVCEARVDERIKFYTTTGAAEGGITGAGGFLMSFVDFPVLLSLKIKLLFDIAALYGYDVKDYKERIFILYVFQMTFSSKKERKKVYELVANFEQEKHKLPEDINQYDWRTLQQQYRDYIDLAKLAQMVPYIGAAVGFVANWQLVKKLGNTAKQAYRLRYFQQKNELTPIPITG